MAEAKIRQDQSTTVAQTLSDALLNWQTIAAAAVFILSLAIATVQFGDDGFRWLGWTLSLISFALPTLPLALYFFKTVPHVVFPFSMALGLLLISFTSWTLSYLHILPFTNWGIYLIVLLISAACWSKKANRKSVMYHICTKGILPAHIIFMTVFMLACAAWTYVRGLMPKIEGLEKFMDYGFMMSMWRSDWLPAADMWLAGSEINYYYFGQFVYTLLSKFSGINPAYSYNLSMASTFAYMFTLASALGFMLYSLLFQLDKAQSKISVGQIFTAALTAFFVTIGGNSHAFFYADDAPGQGLLLWLSNRGIDVGTWDSFFFSDSTRYVGYNPDVADKTIHEFPYYSFLVADLHAHVVNTVFVLLLLGLFFAYYSKGDERRTRGGTRLPLAVRGSLTNPTLYLCGLLLAVFMMCNFWDFAVYLVVALFIFVSRNLRIYGSASAGSGISALCLVIAALFLPFLFANQTFLALLLYGLAVLMAALLVAAKTTALSRAGLELAVIFFLGHLFSLPFNLYFEAISKSIRLTTDQSTIQQLLILWGGHILIAVLALILLFTFPRTKGSRIQGNFLERVGNRWLIVLLVVSGIGLIIAPEIIYVRDIYEANYARANTMFKFTYQAFILLSLVVGIALPTAILHFRASIIQNVQKRKRNQFSIVQGLLMSLLLIFLMLMPAYYPFVATSGWVPSPATTDWQGIDGTTWMRSQVHTGDVNGVNEQYDLSVDAAAIDWFNEYIDDQPVILEAAGLSYTHMNRISAYTGLPTVLGWETHEWLWRTSRDSPNAYADLIYPKQQDVEAVYTWSDPTRAVSVLRENQVQYIIIGELELLRYPDINLDQLAALGETVFHQGLMRIIQINPHTLG